MAQKIVWTGYVIPNGGINETRSPQEIADPQWSAAMDAEPMPDGVRRRQGCSKSNATAIGATASTATSTIAITGIHDFRTSAGSAWHLVAAGTAVYKNSSGTMTAVGTTMTAGADVTPSFADARDICFVANGTDAGFKFYASGTDEYWSKIGLTAPTANATATVAAGGSLAVGTWYVDYFLWNNDIGAPSNTRYAGATSVAATTSSGTQTIVVSGLPTVVAAGERATHVRVSLRSPSGQVFRFAGTAQAQVTLGTSTATIDADATVDPDEYDNDAPPAHSINCAAENRLFVAGIVSYPYRVQWSKITGTTSLYTCFPALNFRDFGKGDANVVTALAFIPPRTLVVGFKNQIAALDARRPGTSDVLYLSKDVGIAHHRAWIVVGQTLFFVSDADQTKGPWMWDGSGVKPVPGIDTTFMGLNKSRLQYTRCEHYAPGDGRFQWWISVSYGSTPDRVLVYDYRIGSWTVYSHDANAIGHVVETGVTRLYFGGRDGHEYLADTGTTDAGSAYTGYVQGKAIDFGMADAIKRLRFVRYTAKEQTTGAMSCELERDYGQMPAVSVNLPQVDVGNLFTLGTSVLGGTDVLGGTGVTNQRVAVNAQGRLFRWKVGSSSPWYLKGIAFGAQPTGRR